MTITYHTGLIQGSDEWLAARCGLLTASEMHLILTPTLKIAANDKTRAHVWEMAAQRLTQFVEPTYIGDEMLRGREDEMTARYLYNKHVAPVEEVGFVTNDSFGFTLGYSPDGLVGSDGLVECKSRRQKFQVQTVVEWYRDGTTPPDFMLQCQTGLLVTGRAWIDLVSYSGGMPMMPMRVHVDEKVRTAILEAAAAKIRCSEAAEKGGGIAHQVHGAIGFTIEHILHRYSLRALAWRDDFGSESYWAVELGKLVANRGADELWPLVASR